MADIGPGFIDVPKDLNLQSLLDDIETQLLEVPIDIVSPVDIIGLSSSILEMSPSPERALELMKRLNEDAFVAAWLLACVFHYGYAKALHDSKNSS